MPAHEASACGGFFVAGHAQVPSLSIERVLIAFNRPSETEHFIRELVFENADAPFGFVVPTPSRPTVAKVDGDIWKTLEDRFPYRQPHIYGLQSVGGGSGRGSGGVQVLAVQRVGSFTAFTLAAEDAGALEQWLAKNKFENRPETRAWLEHYVRSKFFYVAFRYEPSPGAADRTLRAETVRITFSSTHPFYPYLEPDRDARTPPAPERVVALWLVSQKRMTPVAAVRTEAGGVVWEKPWREGWGVMTIPSSSLREILPAVPWPGGDVVVQTFEDQKTSRRGWGDVVLVPVRPEEPDPATIARRRALDADALAKEKALFAVLDPALDAPP